METLVSLFLLLTKTGVVILVAGIIGVFLPVPFALWQRSSGTLAFAGLCLAVSSLILAIVAQSIAILLPTPM